MSLCTQRLDSLFYPERFRLLRCHQSTWKLVWRCHLIGLWSMCSLYDQQEDPPGYIPIYCLWLSNLWSLVVFFFWVAWFFLGRSELYHIGGMTVFEVKVEKMKDDPFVLIWDKSRKEEQKNFWRFISYIISDESTILKAFASMVKLLLLMGQRILTAPCQILLTVYVSVVKNGIVWNFPYFTLTLVHLVYFLYARLHSIFLRCLFNALLC